MSYRLLVLLTLALGIFSFAAGCADNDKESAKVLPGAEQCQTILQKNCVQCHQLARVCQRLGDKNKKDWEKTITRMVNNGAKLTSKEQAIISACLYSQAAGVMDACK